MKKKFDCGCEFEINKNGGLDINLDEISYECSATWDLIGEGRTVGCFQIESKLCQNWCKRVKPRSLSELSDVIAMVRPGVLQAKDERGISMPELYARRKFKEEEYIESIEPIAHILQSTQYVMCFQEQAMQIARDVANFDIVQVDKFRKSIGKKDMKALAETGELFISKSVEFGKVNQEQAEALFDNIRKSGRYLFNKCISFDSKILRYQTGGNIHTVEEMYKIRNDKSYAVKKSLINLHNYWNKLGNYGNAYSMDHNQRILPNTIKDIRFSGKRDIYRVITESGTTTRCSDNHKFPTNLGELTVSQILDLNPWEVKIYLYKMDDENNSKVSLDELNCIIADGQCDTYDVEMEGPNHNFVLDSGIVTCNSHSWSYADTAYITAFRKAHFLKKSYCSDLKFSANESKPLDEIRKIAQDAKKVNVEIRPPEFLHLEPCFDVKDGYIYFGLSNVKDISENAVANMKLLAAHCEQLLGKPKEEWTWLEFLIFFTSERVELASGIKYKVTSTIINRMIEVGALPFLIDRQIMQAEYARIWNELGDGHITWIKKNYNPEWKTLLDVLKAAKPIKREGGGSHDMRGVEKVNGLIKILEEIPRQIFDTARFIAQNEYNNLGVALTCSALDESRSLFSANCTCKEFTDGKLMKNYILAGEVIEVKPYKCKSGQSIGQYMAFLTLEDSSGVLDNICIFPSDWEKVEHLVYPNALLLLAGNKDSNRGSFIVKNAQPI